MGNEYTKSRGSFKSSDGDNNIGYYIYEPEKPRAVIQLSHGMCEYVERYERHARYFCSQGFAFAGNDHLGHGGSAAGEDGLGFIGSADCTVDDLAHMTELLREKFSGLPLILLGHSMGSFIARCYMTKYGERVDAVILSGTAGPGNPTALGKLLAKRAASKNGRHFRSEKLRNIAMGSYNKRFAGEGSAAWISSEAAEVEKYLGDKYCNYIFTVDGYYNMFELLGRVSDKKWAYAVRKDLPVLLISGADDPVGAYGKGVKKVYDRLARAGVCDLEMKLYDSARHELLNEREEIRREVYELIVKWINERVEK